MRILKYLLLFSFGIPVLFFASEILYLEFAKKSGKELILPIAGYDPRDLLAGHYLRYNISFQTEALCLRNDSERISNHKASENSHCVCYSHSGKILEGEGLFVEKCEPDTLKSRELCRVYLRGICQYGRFKIGNERYYVNEQKALDYEARLRKEKDVHIRLKVNEEGRAITDALIWEDGSSL
ncbi:GDYXXLXY domain-containing protein [Leptospira sp. 201903070]|uniref:GDYXXLXY domain-containing protein n=1 Tax=Leptospira ainlahdjerensis TaxID=2810033 RepID=A0ABS2UFP2_9LEPT|nr:GDYXXLXY domain-containing protein [Leptospira ainlahdjerensis]MBM9578773.1 GDYXXLXY domain-containing protein [Leptospira ainlahdjerensis]